MFAIRRSVGILKGRTRSIIDHIHLNLWIGCRFAPRWHQFLNAFSTNVPPTTSQSSDSSKIRINTKYTEEEMITNDLLKALSLDTANSRTLLKARVQRTMDRFKLHNSDTGSSSVQSTIKFWMLRKILLLFYIIVVAILTQKIANLARHFASHRKDHASGRGFQAWYFFYVYSARLLR